MRPPPPDEEILPFASIVMLSPATNAETTLVFVKYRLPAVSITLAVYKLFHTLAVIVLAVTVSDEEEPEDTLPANTESVTLMPRIINPFAVIEPVAITLPAVMLPLAYTMPVTENPFEFR